MEVLVSLRSKPGEGGINLLEISRLWMEETFNSQDPFV